ncbi:MAG: hypothetical protein JWQ23_4470 [Herminiimonas sp.]|nr:hypothetical protein [Herminiimonas sp.]
MHALTGKWENLGIDLVKARDRAAHYNDDAESHGSVGWFLDEYLAHFEALVKDGKKAARTLSDYRKYASPVKAYFGNMSPDAVAAQHVKSYLDMNHTLGRGVSANRERALLSGAFSWMISTGRVTIKLNPCLKTGRNKEAPRGRYVSDEEYKVVHALATPNVQLAMDLIVKTLQRPSDVLRYRRDAIQVVGGKKFFSFMQGKTGKEIQIEIDDDFELVLTRAALTGDYLIVSRLDQPYTPSGIAAMLHRYQKVGGIASFGLQDLQVKGAIDMVEAGIPLKTVSDLLGHSSIATTEIHINRHLKTRTAYKKTTPFPGKLMLQFGSVDEDS